MKQKISISMDEELILELEQIAKQDLFRNKSHIVEYAVKKLLREKK